MERIYFDNAATTPLDPEVLSSMMPYLTDKFGNPSSIYSYGRETRMAIENARKSVSSLLGVHPGELFFTSGGTESTNTAITAAIRDLGCTHLITSPIEHHATLHACEFFHQHLGVALSLVNLLPDGHLDLNHLENLLSQHSQKTLVSLMHANNDIGNLLELERVGELCHQYGAFLHCDTVQTLGHYPLDLKKMQVHFAGGAAHKFHGPKGTGILYVHEKIKIHPLVHGGSQERNMRAGTENVYAIVGMARALEMAMAEFESRSSYIQELRLYMAAQLLKYIPGLQINGDLYGRSLYTILNVSFPLTDKNEMLLFNLDINGVCASGGSACTSGANLGSHVIQAVYPDNRRVAVRFSFSHQNTRAEVDQVVGVLQKLG
ncbi:MAG: cysteine desulfurase family protein [Chitinophagaceae bacterium]